MPTRRHHFRKKPRAEPYVRPDLKNTVKITEADVEEEPLQLGLTKRVAPKRVWKVYLASHASVLCCVGHCVDLCQFLGCPADVINKGVALKTQQHC